MATHSRVLTWRIPGTGEPGGLPSMGSHGVGHDWSDLAAVAARYLKISFISRHTWMIAWLSRILDYQSYFGTAGSFFFSFNTLGMSFSCPLLSSQMSAQTVKPQNLQSASWSLSTHVCSFVFGQETSRTLLISGSPSLCSGLLPSTWPTNVNYLNVRESQFLSYLLSDFILYAIFTEGPMEKTQVSVVVTSCVSLFLRCSIQCWITEKLFHIFCPVLQLFAVGG